MQYFHFSINPIYLQTDPRWIDQKIGGSQEKFGAVGCTVTCVSMALSHFGIKLLPDKLNELIKHINGYTKDGCLIWNSISKITNNKINIKVPCRPDYDSIDSALRKNQPVIAKVFLNGRVPHWVLIIGKDKNEYLIKDPLGDGKSINKISKFNSNIYSIRIVTRKF
jgi:ABC-type bacteriocin/lantibiotic exporter with double-glycine peptidase domain